MLLLIVAFIIMIALASFFAGKLWERGHAERVEYAWTKGEWTFRAPTYDALIKMIIMFQPDAFHQGGGEDKDEESNG